MMTKPTRAKPLAVTAVIPAQAPALPARADTKVAKLVALLTRNEGATVDQLVSATRWQPHTSRAALTRLKARGYAVTSMKVDGVRTYHAIGPVAS
jgi:hypothetical protein